MNEYTANIELSKSAQVTKADVDLGRFYNNELLAMRKPIKFGEESLRRQVVDIADSSTWELV